MQANVFAPLTGAGSAGLKTLTYQAIPTFAEYQVMVRQRALLASRVQEIRLAPDDQAFFINYPEAVHLLMVAGNSPDTVAVLPVLAHLAAMSPRLELRVLHKEAAAVPLARLTGAPASAATLAETALPLLLVFDEEWRLRGQWGPHPQAIKPHLERWLAHHPEFERLAESDVPAGRLPHAQLVEQLTQKMRLWYNSGLNAACAREVRALLAEMHGERSAGNGLVDAH
jgi:hypothetical protein